MKRENILALVLVISLCANVYLVFFDHSILTQHIPKLSNNTLLPSLVPANSSGGSSFMVDEYGEVVPLPGTDDEGPLPDTPDNESREFSPGEMEEIPDDTLDEADILYENPGSEDEMPLDLPEEVILDPFINYTSAKHAFSLVYSRNWTANEATAGRTVLTLKAPEETSCDTRNNQCYVYVAQLTVEIDSKPHTLIIEDYFNKAVSQLQIQHGITTTSKISATVLSDSRACQIEYFTRDTRGNPDRSFMQYYTIIDGKGYIISYFGPYSSWDGVYRNNKADAQQIINSIMVERSFKPV